MLLPARIIFQYFLGKVPKGRPGKLENLICTITSKRVLIGLSDNLGSSDTILTFFTHPGLERRTLSGKIITRIIFKEGEETERANLTLEKFYEVLEESREKMDVLYVRR
jgi:hypothetical protein